MADVDVHVGTENGADSEERVEDKIKEVLLLVCLALLGLPAREIFDRINGQKLIIYIYNSLFFSHFSRLKIRKRKKEEREDSYRRGSKHTKLQRRPAKPINQIMPIQQNQTLK